MCECAWSASRKKDSFFKSKYHRIKSRRGAKRALVAVGHAILTTCYCVLKRKIAYQEFSVINFDIRKKEKIVASYVKRLSKIGYDVTINVSAPDPIHEVV